MEKRTPIIVIADDDADDRLLLKEAFERCKEEIIVHLVEDGEELKMIPLLIYTALGTYENVRRCYDLGVNTVIHKYNTFDELEQTAKSIYNYWFKAATSNQ
ncbi:MAG: hypothetical protein ACLQVJ_02735 [Syntrophobacteraceae bacterium]